MLFESHTEQASSRDVHSSKLAQLSFQHFETRFSDYLKFKKRQANRVTYKKIPKIIS